MGAFANQFEAHERSHPSSQVWTLRSLFLGQRRAARVAGSPVGEYEQWQVIKEDSMTKAVRYQKGQLYRDHGAWFVRYRERVRKEDGSIKLQRKSKRLGSVEKHPTKSDIEP